MQHLKFLVNLRYKNYIKYSIIFPFILLLVISCKTDPNKKRIEGDISKRLDERAEKGGGIFGNIGKNRNTFEFSTSNPLWRAALEALDFVPLTSVNYSGGIIVSDWYSNQLNSPESVKIEVRFLSSEVSASSIKVISYKRLCNLNNNGNCKTVKLGNNFNKKIHNSILQTAKKIKIEQEEKDKKQ